MNTTHHPAAKRGSTRAQRRAPVGRRDAGAVLAFVLVFFVFVGLTVAATLTFASTLMRNRPPINERNARVEAVRSAMRMAIQFQRDHGVADCFEDNQTFVFNEGSSEETSANVSCSIGPVEELSNNYFREGGDAFALVTTLRDGSLPAVSGSEDPSSAPLKVLAGNVFIGGGDFDTAPVPPRATGVDILVGNQTDGAPSDLLTTRLAGDRYWNGVANDTCDNPLIPGYLPSSGTVNGTAHSNVFQCTDLEWTERVGTRIAPAPTWSYPTLPGIPANNRPVFNPRQFPIGSPACQVIFPGRYDMPITLDSGGDYYLPSGVYYFTKPVTISNGSTVVAGQGRTGGCEVDSTVLLDPRTIDSEATSITGRGATFLLDEDATLNIDDGRLFINRRISTPSTRGSEGVSIRAVQTSTINTASLYVPEDQVVTGVDSDGHRILEPASTYNIGAGALRYSGLTAPDVDVPLLTADFRGHTGSGLVVDGNIFIPQGKFTIAADNSDYQIDLDGGVVASRAVLDISAMPADPSDWYFGVDASPLLRRVELVSTATVNGKTARSIARFQVNSIGSYAINSWAIDTNYNGGGSVPPTTVPTTTVPPGPTTTVPPGPTTTVPPGPTTTVPPGPTTTVPPGCGSDDADWYARYYNGTSLSNFKFDQQDASPNFDWGGGSPNEDDLGRNTFSITWSKTENFPGPGIYRFTVGSDDGTRLYVNGTRVLNNWRNQSYDQSVRTVDVEIQDECQVELEMHYYENRGQAKVSYDWMKVS